MTRWPRQHATSLAVHPSRVRGVVIAPPAPESEFLYDSGRKVGRCPFSIVAASPCPGVTDLLRARAQSSEARIVRMSSTVVRGFTMQKRSIGAPS